MLIPKHDDLCWRMLYSCLFSIQSDHCDCHVKDSPSDATSRNAQNKLWIACGIALVFMIAEVVGQPCPLSHPLCSACILVSGGGGGGGGGGVERMNCDVH